MEQFESMIVSPWWLRLWCLASFRNSDREKWQTKTEEKLGRLENFKRVWKLN